MGSRSLACLRLCVAAACLACLAACGGSDGPTALNLSGAVSNLTTSSTTGAIEARLVNANGTSYANQQVSLSGVAASRQTSQTLTTDANGIVRVGSLAPGSYTIAAGSVNLNVTVVAAAIATRRFDLGSPATPRTDLGLLYVANNLGNTLSVVDTDSLAVQNNVLTTGNVPNVVRFRAGVGYVVNSVSNTVQRFNPATMQTLDAIATGDNSAPQDLAFASDTKAYVSLNVGDQVGVVDLAGGKLSSTIAVGVRPEGLLVHNGKLYVCCNAFNLNDFSYGDGTVSVIDLATDQVVATISLGVGTNPRTLVAGQDGKLYVVCTGDYMTTGGQVLRIDPATNQKTGDALALQAGAAGLLSSSSIAVGADGKAYVNGGFGQPSLHQLDTATGTVTKTGANAVATGADPAGVVVAPNGRIFVMNFSGDSLSVFDGTSLARVGADVNVGDGPIAGSTRAVRPAKAVFAAR